VEDLFRFLALLEPSICPSSANSLVSFFPPPGEFLFLLPTACEPKFSRHRSLAAFSHHEPFVKQTSLLSAVRLPASSAPPCAQVETVGAFFQLFFLRRHSTSSFSIKIQFLPSGRLIPASSPLPRSPRGEGTSPCRKTQSSKAISSLQRISNHRPLQVKPLAQLSTAGICLFPRE